MDITDRIEESEKWKEKAKMMRPFTIRTYVATGFLALALISVNLMADDGPASQPYRKKEISDARFGQGSLQQLLQKVYTLQNTISQNVVGQDRAARALQDRLIQYLENFGTRTKDPVALHLIGLPGVGKSSILDSLEKVGIKVIRIDAQEFTGQNVQNAMNRLNFELQMATRSQAPTILLFDELDKVPEIVASGNEVKEATSPLIGLINQILTDGRAVIGGSNFNLSNMFVMSAMNFAPEEIEAFSKNALGSPKSFYDFTTEDFSKFDQWVRSSPNARSQVLSRLFRSNTVSRIAPNAMIVKPLSDQDYRKIAQINVDSTIQKATSGANHAKRVSVRYTQNYVDFLAKNTVFPPSGARDTIIKSNALTEQLISFGAKASPPGDRSINQPREISLDVNANGEVEVTVTPKLRKGKDKISEGKSFSFPVEYDAEDRTFYRPQFISSTPPALPDGAQTGQKKLSRKEVYETRFPKGSDQAKGLASRIDQSVIGQEEYTKHIENELGAFLARKEPVTKSPPFTVFAGFPGIGKSEIVTLAGKEAGLPIVRLNMQNYSSDTSDVGDRLLGDLEPQISMARMKRPDGKFIFQIEELDKVFEIDPVNGNIKNRPAMTLIKDLLNDGKIEGNVRMANSQRQVSVDIRNAYSVITMNFAVDRFGFKADPRLTSIEDVRSAWKRLSTRPADLKKVLGSMFLPETVNRIMPMVKIVKPLDQKSYEQIIDNQVGTAVRDRVVDQKTGVNRGEIEVKLSPAYKNYLYSETVIPSEGARYTAVSSRAKISTDLEQALKKLPRSSRLATQPLEITLDYDPGHSSVSAIARSTAPNSKATPKNIFDRPVSLSFPPLDAHGAIPEERVLVAVHEFGHAFTAVRQGKRFEYATVVPPENGLGGYVKFKGNPLGAKNLISDIYAALGSRAMERVFFSKDPVSPSSISEISVGASGDIQQATKSLWNLIYEYGLDPNGGVIERKGIEGIARYATFADLPADKVEQLSHVMRDMEDYLVKDLLAAHPKSWYQEKITDFARIGGLDEHEFYKLIGFPYPGDNVTPLGTRTALQETFDGVIRKPAQSVELAASYKQGLTQTTAEENLDHATDLLVESMKTRLHSSDSALTHIKLGQTVTGACMKKALEDRLSE